MIQHRALVRHLLKTVPDDRIRNRCALMNTRIRCAEVEARKSGALQGPRAQEPWQITIPTRIGWFSKIIECKTMSKSLGRNKTSKSNNLNRPEQLANVNMNANPAQSFMARKVLRPNTKIMGCYILLWISEKWGEGSFSSRPNCKTLPSRGGPSERQVRDPIMGDPDHSSMSKGLTVAMLKDSYSLLQHHSQHLAASSVFGNQLINTILTHGPQSTTHSAGTNQTGAACCEPSTPGDSWRSIDLCKSSVQFKKEVWALRLKQRTHNWHPSCLIKGKSTGMNPPSQDLALNRSLCKQNGI